MDAEVRAPATDEEWRDCYRLLARSFNLPLTVEKEDEFLGRVHRDRTLAAFVDGEVAATAQVRPFGQFFGGRSVPMGGYSPVGTAPEHRGLGLASAVTAAHFPRLRERGEVVAGLYPSSTQLYRNVGFELGGAFINRRVPARSLHHLKRAPGIRARRARPDDLPAVKRCYRRYAATQQGWLDRPEVWWERVLDPQRGGDQHIYVVDGEGGEVQGYVRWRQVADPGRQWGYNVEVQELCFDATEVMLVLWRLVGTSSTQAEYVQSVAPAEHHLLLLLPDQDLKTSEEIRWMTRIVDAPGAVAARGFPAGVEVGVDLEITDGHCDWNNGCWRLSVAGGTGALEPGGSGAVSIDINGLAALYTGYASARMLRQTGLITTGSADELAALSTAFASAVPWCADFY
ncbi:MAG TPA: GNAT family N-acetyltransferase [Acidimicrobiales bacterium]|nr:GNAT family N-acetyltransferase [Acidimicrobiales bacterium]